jgi:hypothetical protein
VQKSKARPLPYPKRKQRTGLITNRCAASIQLFSCPNRAVLLIPVEHQGEGFLKVPQAAFFDQPVLIQVYSVVVYHPLDVVRAVTAEVGRLLRRQPLGGCRPGQGVTIRISAICGMFLC